MPSAEKTKRNKEMKDLAKKGVSYRKIGKIYGIKQSTAFKIVKRDSLREQNKA